VHDDVTILEGSGELLRRIQPLWAELRLHHAAMGHLWRDEFLASDFDKRCAGLLAKSKGGGIQVLLAVHRASGEVGYCVSTVDSERHGEIDSLFVLDAFRRQGIARTMLTSAMCWLTDRDAKPIRVSILAGNDEAVKLYEQLGFQPRTLWMQNRPAETILE